MSQLEQVIREHAHRLISVSFLLLAGLCTLVACKEQATYQGYVEGQFRYMASPYAGILKQLLVDRGDAVAAGQVLFVLDPLPEQDALVAAQEKLKAIQQQIQQKMADETLATLTYQRQKKLFAQQGISAQQLDDSAAHLTVTQASRFAAQNDLAAQQAVLRQTRWSSEQKTVFSPIASVVFDTYFLPGELVSAYTPVLSLLAAPDIKIVFFIPEVSLSRLKQHDKLYLHCDGCPHGLSAHVSFISPSAEYTPPVIYSNETRANLVFRVEARPDQDSKRFHPGQPITVNLS